MDDAAPAAAVELEPPDNSSVGKELPTSVNTKSNMRRGHRFASPTSSETDRETIRDFGKRFALGLLRVGIRTSIRTR